MTCPFCQKNFNHIKNRIIYEGKNIFVMLSNPRLVTGHLLVIPKRHFERPSDMTKEERKEIFDVVLEFQEKILANIATGCDIRENYRPFVKQNDLKVDHIHFHLIPRELNDEIYEKYEKTQREVFQTMNDKEIEESINILNGEQKKSN